MTDQIKLKAETAKDIAVLSALLQDAAIRAGDLAYEPSRHRFAAVLNRYRWEKSLRKKHGNERVRAGLHFDGVLKASLQHIPLKNPDHVLELLAIQAEPSENGNHTLTLTFAGYAAIRLTVECIDGRMADLLGPWQAKSRPSHAVADKE